MRNFMMLLIVLFSSLNLYAQSCDSTQILGKDPVDGWPWSVARPFPWDNIEGYWQIGTDEEATYLKAVILSRRTDRRILEVSIYRGSVCNKSFAKGTGYIDAAEKNVVQTILVDNQYRFRFKMAMFDMKDVTDNITPSCRKRVLGASFQVIGRSPRSSERSTPLDPDVMEIQNMMLKKLSTDPSVDCKK